jgi:hypothetical protein
MDIGEVRALALGINFEVHGIDATVTRPAPDDTPIDTRIIWLTVDTADVPGGPVTRREGLRGMALRRDEAPTVPRGTEILAPANFGGDPVGWRVDSTLMVFVDHVRVGVLRAPDLDP